MAIVPKKRRKAEAVRGAALVAYLDGHDPAGFGTWILQHLEWMAVHNYSTHTVKRREEILVRFSSWCRTRGIAKPRDVTKPILERYQKHLFEHRKKDERPLCFGSQANTLSVLKSFFSWMTRQNALLWNPASEIELPRQAMRIPRAVLTAAEVEAVLAQIDVATPYGVRDRAMVETLYSTGIRRSELLGLSLSDVDGERGMLLIREGKGKKDRMVPVGARAVQWIDKYLVEVRPHFVVDPKEDALFLNHRGERLDIHAVTHRVREYVAAAKLGKTGSCHLFRHTMATLMLEGGADVRFIQAMLGHASLESTEVYTRVSIRMLKAVHEATHPTARKPTDAPAAIERMREKERAGGEGSDADEVASLLEADLSEDEGESEDDVS